MERGHSLVYQVKQMFEKDVPNVAVLVNDQSLADYLALWILLVSYDRYCSVEYHVIITVM